MNSYTPSDGVFRGRGHRDSGIYEKYFIVQDASANSTALEWDEASVDANGVPMRGLPFPSSVKKYEFCAAPGEYTIHAIDAAGDGWWSGAYYQVLVGGTVVIQEEMNRTSSTRQSTTFTLSKSAAFRTSFSENKATQGGGGAVFWEDAPPKHLEEYRNESDSNQAAYGSFGATPAR
jgi:hypothetical protein